MEEADLPVLISGILQLLLQPGELLGVHVIAVEGEEADISFFKSVVTRSIHIENFVQALIRIVVIPQRRVEFDACVQQGLIRHLELLFKILGAAAAVDVVSEHDHEIEGKSLPDAGHLLGYLILRLFTGSHVAYGGEADRIGFQWELKLVGMREQEKSASENQNRE